MNNKKRIAELEEKIRQLDGKGKSPVLIRLFGKPQKIVGESRIKSNGFKSYKARDVKVISVIGTGDQK